MSLNRIEAVLALSLAVLGFSSVKGFAQDSSETYLRENPNYVPPTSEPLYESQSPGAPISFGNYLQAGGIASFGRSSSPDETGKTAYLAGAQLGYRKGLSSWTRVEFGLQVLRGEAGYENVDIEIPALGIAKIGYGVSYGGGLFGTFGLGFGLASGAYEGNLEGVEVKSDENMSGFVTNVDYMLNFNAKGTLELLAGVAYTSITYDLDSLEGIDQRVDEEITLQFPRVILGLNINI